MTKKALFEPAADFEFDIPTVFIVVYLILWTAAFFDMKPIRMPEVVKEQNIAIQIYERIEESVNHAVVLAKECERTQDRKGPACQGVVALSKSITQLQLINPQTRYIVVERNKKTSKETTEIWNNAGMLRGTAEEIVNDRQIYWMGN